MISNILFALLAFFGIVIPLFLLVAVLTVVFYWPFHFYIMHNKLSESGITFKNFFRFWSRLVTLKRPLL